MGAPPKAAELAEIGIQNAIEWTWTVCSGHSAAIKMGDAYMRMLIAMGALLLVSTASAYAGTVSVPEIDAYAGLAAIGAVGAISALIWERRRKNQN